jgi:Ser/Thr protein kinase RdoA (MazF antagonist)
MLQDGQTDRGSVNEVARVGDTIRRPANRWTRSVHGLLRHLEAVGFDGAPRALGFDDLGREILSFIPGEPARRPWPAHLLETDGVAKLARYLARYHEAVKSYVPPEDAEWHIPDLAWAPGMIIRHGDLGPWNSIWTGSTLNGLIDWDFAEPGNPLADVAQLASRIVPLRGDDHWEKAGFSTRPDM